MGIPGNESVKEVKDMFKALLVFSDMICNSTDLETQSHHSPHKQICYFSN